MAETQTTIRPKNDRPERRQGERGSGAAAARAPDRDLLRGVENALADLERSLDRVVRDAFGDEARDLEAFPVLGVAFQPRSDGRVGFQPFGHLPHDGGRFAEGWRAPVATWRRDGRDGLEFRVELPGVKGRDVDVEVLPDALRVRAEGKGLRYEAECSPGLRLDPDSAEAHCEDGVLTVTCRVAASRGQPSRRLTVR